MLKLGRHWTFQHDNNPKYSSNSTNAWFQKKSRKIQQWPSQSPDLKAAVTTCRPKNITELEAIAHEIFRKAAKKLMFGYASRFAAGHNSKSVLC